MLRENGHLTHFTTENDDAAVVCGCSKVACGGEGVLVETQRSMDDIVFLVVLVVVLVIME